MLADVSFQVTWIVYWPSAVAVTLPGRAGGPDVARVVFAVADGRGLLFVAEGRALLVAEGCVLLVAERSALALTEGPAEDCCAAGIVVARNACACPAAPPRWWADLASRTVPAAATAISEGMSPASISRRRRRRDGGSWLMPPGWGGPGEGSEVWSGFPPVTVTGPAGASPGAVGVATPSVTAASAGREC
jgi:hypothetical protein